MLGVFMCYCCGCVLLTVVMLCVSDAPEAAHNLPPKLVTLFETVGDILKKYRGGKLPKLFKLLPKYENWEQVR